MRNKCSPTNFKREWSGEKDCVFFFRGRAKYPLRHRAKYRLPPLLRITAATTFFHFSRFFFTKRTNRKYIYSFSGFWDISKIQRKKNKFTVKIFHHTSFVFYVEGRPGRGSSIVSRPSLNRLNHWKTCVCDKRLFPYTSFNISISFWSNFPKFHKKSEVTLFLYLTSDHLAFFRRLAVAEITTDEWYRPSLLNLFNTWGKLMIKRSLAGHWLLMVPIFVT